MFFEWRWLGALWSAKDPIYDDARWIIRALPQVIPTQKFELCHVKDGTFTKYQESDHVKELALFAVSKRLAQMTSMKYSYAHLINAERRKKVSDFLVTLTDGELTDDEINMVSSSGSFSDLCLQAGEHDTGDPVG